MSNIIDVSQEAAADILHRVGPGRSVRIGVRAGGCSGLEYVLETCSGVDEGRDLVFTEHGVTFVMDKRSKLFLQGSSVVLEPGPFGGIRIKPKSGNNCSCGKSFSGAVT